MLRRLLAVLTAVVMLHLTLVGGEGACATHAPDGGGDAEMASMAATSSMTSMTHTSAQTSHDAATGARAASAGNRGACAAPVPARCCDAAASCGVSLAAGRVGAATLRVARSGEATPADDHGWWAPRAAPEPPPPKA